MDASIADPAGRAARQRSGPNVFSRVEIEYGMRLHLVAYLCLASLRPWFTTSRGSWCPPPL